MPRLTYKYDWKKIKEKALSSHQKSYRIGSVMDAVKKAVSSGLMEDPYTKYESMKSDEITEVKLHASRGTKLQADGGNVLEFDLSGSGFSHFRARHAEISGENEYYKDGVLVPFKDIRKHKKWTVHWYNKIKWPDFIKNLFDIPTEQEIMTQNEVIDQFSKPSEKTSVKGKKESGIAPQQKKNLPEESQRMQNPQMQNMQAGSQQVWNPQMQNMQTGSQPMQNPQMQNMQPANQQMLNQSPEGQSPVNSQMENTLPSEQQTEINSIEQLLKHRYGDHPTIEGLEGKKHIYVKTNNIKKNDGTTVNRTRYTMPGPLTTILGFVKGTRNRGDYTINNVSEYMLTAAKDYLKPIFDKWDRDGIDRQKDSPVTIMAKGHSRGGVAASHGTMKIKNWISENYPQYEDMVKFELTQLDPVAGLGSDHGVKRAINLVEEDREDLKKEMEERGMKTLGKSAETTLVYSLHTDHALGFSPQIVDGAKRIILTATKHSVNLDNIDESQKEFGDMKSHRGGYMDLSTGEMYRNSGLTELPEGIYIADENNRLIKIPSLEAGRNILGEVLKNTSLQKGRHRRIDEVMEKWFTSHSLEKTACKEKITLTKDTSLKSDNKIQRERTKKTSTLHEERKSSQKIPTRI